MKRIAKKAIGRCIIPFVEWAPQWRKLLSSLGMRTSQGLFGNRTVSVQFSEGGAFRLTHVDQTYLAFQLFWLGGQFYEPITRALVQALLRNGDTFLDIGAHVGFYSLTTGLSNPAVSVIAFEPNPKNFRILEANVAANSLSNIICEPIAISDKDGTGMLYLTESDMSASLMKDFQAEDTKQIGSIEVSTSSLDSYRQRRGIEGRLLIKVDIEGHEPAFFRGAADTIAKHKPDIILEVLYEQEPALVSQLKSLGYHFYPITDQDLIELDAPKLVKRFPFLFLNHLLSVRPKEELAPLFEGIREEITKINLLETSKHFPKEEWPKLWED